MNKQRVQEVMKETFAEVERLRGAGQAEYARRDANAFANFERVAERLGVSREKVLMVYAEKHLDGIHSYIDGHRSQREHVFGRIDDLINYMILLKSMIKEEEEFPRVPIVETPTKES